MGKKTEKEPQKNGGGAIQFMEGNGKRREKNIINNQFLLLCHVAHS